jgi:dTDP-4-dehydrorhamnose 3,5-epimerase
MNAARFRSSMASTSKAWTASIGSSLVKPGQASVRRGWVGHRREHKWFTVVQGDVLLAVVQPDDWEQPSSDLPVARYRLSGDQPQVLHVPPGYATGWTHLEQNTVLMIFSSGKIEDAKSDDFRFPVDHWPVQA